MAKSTKKEQRTSRKQPPKSQDPAQAEIQSLLQQKKYRQALEAIKNIRRSQPDLVLTLSEGDIWLLRGKEELQQKNFKQAESSLRQALTQGMRGEIYYLLSQCLLVLNRGDAALALLQDAFQQGNLAKNDTMLYAKFLVFKGDTTRVEQLLQQSPELFTPDQQRWLRGMLALKADQPEAALEHFLGIEQPVTPGDVPAAWRVYAYQRLGNWEEAAAELKRCVSPPVVQPFARPAPPRLEPPILQQLADLQEAKTGQPLFPEQQVAATDLPSDMMLVLDLLRSLGQRQYHHIGHLVLRLGRRTPQFPEVEKLRPTLLRLAGQQAFNQDELDCAIAFWQTLLSEQPFDPQLAVNLLEALDLVDAHREKQRLLTQLIRWLEQQGKQNPQNWPPDRLNLTLANAHCRVADSLIGQGKTRAAYGSVQQAERICSTSPEVLGRRGIIAAVEDRLDEAKSLLTQALETGCQYGGTYRMLTEILEDEGDRERLQEIRRRFGQRFGDLVTEAEVDLPSWVQALMAPDYSYFEGLVTMEEQDIPATLACQIFVDATNGETTASGRIFLDQAVATQEWERLLTDLTPKEQIPVLQAIVLSIYLFAKRAKGIAALIKQYQQRLLDLAAVTPEAWVPYLAVLAITTNQAEKLRVPLRAYLDSMPQPGNALAEVQLQVRQFTQTEILRPFIDQALSREPQNPLLLLAKATTYLPDQPEYETLKDQGFDLARRLQDAQALQAFRVEQRVLTVRETQQLLPSPSKLRNLRPGQLGTLMDDFLEQLIRKAIGNDVPPGELEELLPELKQKMLENLGGLGGLGGLSGLGGFEDFGEFFEEEPDFGFNFLPPSFGSIPPKSKKPNRGFG